MIQTLVNPPKEQLEDTNLPDNTVASLRKSGAKITFKKNCNK